MMYTIKPKNEGIISWLLKYGTMQHNSPDTHRDGNNVAVCLVKFANSGPVARICYSRMELHRAKDDCQWSTEPRRWFWVPSHVLKPFMHGQEIK